HSSGCRAGCRFHFRNPLKFLGFTGGLVIAPEMLEFAAERGLRARRRVRARRRPIVLVRARPGPAASCQWVGCGAAIRRAARPDPGATISAEQRSPGCTVDAADSSAGSAGSPG